MRPVSSRIYVGALPAFELFAGSSFLEDLTQGFIYGKSLLHPH
jgi:hypothetical protein